MSERDLYEILLGGGKAGYGSDTYQPTAKTPRKKSYVPTADSRSLTPQEQYGVGSDYWQGSQRSPGITPPPAVPNFGMFDQQLATIRAQADQQYQAALAEIARQEGIGLGYLNKYPGQIKEGYGFAKQGVNQFANMALEAARGSGVKPLAPKTSGLEPFYASLAFGKNSAQQMLPYLQGGVTDLAQRQRGQAGLAKSQMDSELAQQQLGLQSDLQKTQYDAELRRWEMENNAKQDQYTRDQELRAKLLGTDPESQVARSTFSKTTISAERGKYFTPQEQDEIRKFRSYDAIWKDIQDAQEVTVTDANGKVTRKYTDGQILQLIQRKWSAQPRAASLALYEFAQTLGAS